MQILPNTMLLYKKSKKVNNNSSNIDDKLQDVFDYTKPQFHDTNFTPIKKTKRSSYSDAVLTQVQFNDELQIWKTLNTKNNNSGERERFAAHLSQKYLCDKLDKLESSEQISKIRKDVAKQIDELENPKEELLVSEDLFANMTLKIDECDEDEEYSEEEYEYEDCNDINNGEIRIPTDNINLCFVGGVSTGKSTVLNGVFCEELTQCKIKRTTMWPTVYVENEHIQDISTEEILKIISEKNREIIEKTESGQKIDKDDYKELAFNVGKLDINILENSYVNVYDIPGLNDARTKDIYYNYLETNFHKFNLVVFMVDIHSGLNTSDEMDMLNFIINNTKDQFKRNQRHIYTLVIVNKADDMQTEEDSDKLEITGELKEMFEQVENTVQKEFTNKGLKDNIIGIIPLCAKDAYLYRMVKKHGKNFKLSAEQILKIGVNENGKKFSTLKPATQEARVNDILKDVSFVNTMIKLSGFSRLESILHKFLKDNDKGSKLRIDNLMYELKKLPKLYDFTFGQKWFNMKSLAKLVEQYNKIYENVKLIDKTEYDIIMSSFVSEIINIVKEKVYSWNGRIDELIDNYDKFNNEIRIPYLYNDKDYYNTTTYPSYLTDKVIKLIQEEVLDGVVSISDIIHNLEILEKITHFNKETIELFIETIMKNIRSENTILFSEKDTITDFTRILDKCSQEGSDLSEFLRFMVINQLNYLDRDSDCDIYVKGLLYEKYGELPIRSYISHKFKVMPSIQQIIRGIKPEDFINSSYELDLYYLNYEKNKNSINFTNN